MGPSEPPGTTYIPGLRENLHGLFSINLGVYVPEVSRVLHGGQPRSWIQEYYCCVRMRLGALIGNGEDTWWRAQASDDVIASVRDSLHSEGLPFIDKYSTRDRILAEWAGTGRSLAQGNPPRIVLAIINVERGRMEEARKLLCFQVQDAHNPRHSEYVQELARTLGLGDLNG